MSALQWEKIRTHNTQADAWIVLHGNVYNVSNFLEDHPGGKELLLEQAGQDASAVFEEAAHSSEARDMLPAMLVGRLEGHHHAVESFDALHGTGMATTQAKAGNKAATWRRAIIAPAVMSALAFLSWAYGRDKIPDRITWPSGFAGGTNYPWWVWATVISFLAVLGIFSTFFSYIIYVDFGRLDKYPARVSID